jgi:hypothetical protein
MRSFWISYGLEPADAARSAVPMWKCDLLGSSPSSPELVRLIKQLYPCSAFIFGFVLPFAPAISFYILFTLSFQILSTASQAQLYAFQFRVNLPTTSSLIFHSLWKRSIIAFFRLHFTLLHLPIPHDECRLNSSGISYAGDRSRSGLAPIWH